MESRRSSDRWAPSITRRERSHRLLTLSFSETLRFDFGALRCAAMRELSTDAEMRLSFSWCHYRSLRPDVGQESELRAERSDRPEILLAIMWVSNTRIGQCTLHEAARANTCCFHLNLNMNTAYCSASIYGRSASPLGVERQQSICDGGTAPSFRMEPLPPAASLDCLASGISAPSRIDSWHPNAAASLFQKNSENLNAKSTTPISSLESW